MHFSSALTLLLAGLAAASSSSETTERRLERARRMRFNDLLRDNKDSRSTFYVAIGSDPLQFLATVDPATGVVETQPGTHNIVRQGPDTCLLEQDLSYVETMTCPTSTGKPTVFGRDKNQNFIQVQFDEFGRFSNVEQLYTPEDPNAKLIGAASGGPAGHDESENLFVYEAGDDFNGLVQVALGEGARRVGGFSDSRFPDEAAYRDNSLSFSPNGYLYHSNNDTIRVMSTVNGFRSTVGIDLVWPSWQQVQCDQNDLTTCGNGVCETADEIYESENYLNCPADCAGKLYGTNKYCCGGGNVTSTPCEDILIGCDDERCSPTGPNPEDNKQCAYIVDNIIGDNEEYFHDFKPTVFDMEFEPEFGGLYAVVATLGDPQDFRCNDRNNVYKWFAKIDSETGVVNIISAVPQSTSGFTICRGRTDSELSADVHGEVEESLSEITGYRSSTESSYTTSDFYNYVDNYVHRLFEDEDCFFDLRLPEAEPDTDNSEDEWTTAANLITKPNGDEDPEGGAANEAESVSRVLTASGTSSLSSKNAQVQLEAVRVLQRHFNLFAYEIFDDDGNAANFDIDGTTTVDGHEVPNCEFLRNTIAAAFNFTDERDSTFKPSDIVIVARTLSFEDPLLVKNNELLQPWQRKANRVEFLLKPCSRTKQHKWAGIRSQCEAFALCGDAAERVELPAGTEESRYDCNSCPLIGRADQLNLCIASGVSCDVSYTGPNPASAC